MVTDDGYVSRNVYDYDEPEPPADVREALEPRYVVTRRDGRDAPGQKHHGCRYFVLDLTHDPKADPLVRAYFAEPPADVREARASAWQEGFDHAITWTEGPDWADAPRNPYRPDAIEEVRRG